MLCDIFTKYSAVESSLDGAGRSDGSYIPPQRKSPSLKNEMALSRTNRSPVLRTSINVFLLMVELNIGLILWNA